MRPKTRKIFILLTGTTFIIGPFDEIDRINKQIGAKLMENQDQGLLLAHAKYGILVR